MESIGFTANLVPAYHVKNRDRSILRTIVLGGKDRTIAVRLAAWSLEAEETRTDRSNPATIETV